LGVARLSESRLSRSRNSFTFLFLWVNAGWHCYICGLVGGSSTSEGFRAYFVVILLEFTGEFTKLCIIFIELITISDNFPDIRVKLRRSSISLTLQIFLDSLQVHGFLDNIKIVRNVQCNRINRIFEGP
jgi:hypothetical protein